MFIGTYTGTTSRGICHATLDPQTGVIGEPTLLAESRNPSFLAIHPTRPLLYSAMEIGDYAGTSDGAVGAFAIEPGRTRALTPLNLRSSGGSGPCHVSVDPTGRVVLVANYGSGTVAALAIEPDGSLRGPAGRHRHDGPLGPRRDRQDGPHAHSIQSDAASKFALAADLGTDEVRVYKLDLEHAALTPHEPASLRGTPGAGPRHMAWHPARRHLYVINELDNTILTCAWDSQAGTLEPLQTIGTLPEGVVSSSSTTAEVTVHPTGKFVYGSNRGHDSIAVFGVDAQTGTLHPRGHVSTQGRTPRHFAIDPSGQWLVVANQDGDSLVSYRINESDGTLTPSGSTRSLGQPVCVRFIPQAIAAQLG